MAKIAATLAKYAPSADHELVTGGLVRWERFFWEALGDGDEGETILLNAQVYAMFAEATGTFSGSASLAFHGGGSAFAALLNEAGSTIALTGAGQTGFSNQPPIIKPVITGGDVSTDVDVALYVLRAA